MAETILEHVYKLKGGQEEAVELNNPFLERREPIVVYCRDGSTRLKIGDGVHYYNELDWVKGFGGEDTQEIETFPSHFDFPVPGDGSVIYRASNEATLYQWSPSKYKYEPLVNANIDFDVDISDIETIHGGNALDLLIG